MVAGLSPAAVVVVALGVDASAVRGAAVVDDAAAGCGLVGVPADAGAGVVLDEVVEVEVELVCCGAAASGTR